MKKIIYILLLIPLFFLFTSCKDQKTYIVTFEANGGTFAKNQVSITKKYVLHRNERIYISNLIEEPTKEGYFFKGWSKDANDDSYSQQISLYGAPGTNKDTYYAKWIEDDPSNITSKKLSLNEVSFTINNKDSKNTKILSIDLELENYFFDQESNFKIYDCFSISSSSDKDSFRKKDFKSSNFTKVGERYLMIFKNNKKYIFTKNQLAWFNKMDIFNPFDKDNFFDVNMESNTFKFNSYISIIGEQTIKGNVKDIRINEYNISEVIIDNNAKKAIVNIKVSGKIEVDITLTFNISSVYVEN